MRNNYQNLVQLAEQLVSYGKSKGADEIQVSLNEVNDFTVEVRNKNIERLIDAGTKGMGIKVILDKKVATASSSDLSIDTLHKLIDNAIERAKLSSPDPCAGLPEKERLNVEISSLDLFDPKILELTPEEKIKRAREIEEIGLSDKRIKISGGSYFGTNHGAVVLANSNGFSGFYDYTICYSGLELQAGEGDNVVEDGWHSSAIHFSKLFPSEVIAKKAIDRTVKLIGSRKIKTQNVPVVMEPQMTASLLGFLSQCLSGGAIYMNQSFLTGKIDRKIANENITIVDDALIPQGLGSHPFDSEGVPGRRNTIIDSGVLKSYLLDTYAGRKLKMKTTGHASGPTNFYMAAGKYSPDEIIKSVDKGLYLTKTIGQGTVPTSGDISKGAFGMWIEKGELTYPVAEITISGNLGKILNDIEMVGSDLEFLRSMNGPTIKIKEMTISGT